MRQMRSTRVEAWLPLMAESRDAETLARQPSIDVAPY
jgi:hypothetical protein